MLRGFQQKKAPFGALKKCEGGFAFYLQLLSLTSSYCCSTRTPLSLLIHLDIAQDGIPYTARNIVLFSHSRGGRSTLPEIKLCVF